MSFYVRYVLTDDRAVTAGDLERVLRAADRDFTFDQGLIRRGQTELGLIDITTRGDPICDGDLDLLARRGATKRRREAILTAVRNATGMVCVQLVNAREPDADDALKPLWEWLLANRSGLLAREGGHFYDRTGHLM